MNFADLIYILKRIFISPHVIGIGIAMFLYLSLVFFVVNYRKDNMESVRIEKRKPSAPAASSKAKQDNEEDGEE